jgi:hypothetical protein
MALALCTVPITHAYTTTESIQTDSAGAFVMVMETLSSADACTALDPGSHLAMATNAAIQQKIVETAQNGALTSNIPMGGGTMQATCTSQVCTWRWHRGFYYYVWPVFYRGVYYTGPHSSAAAAPIDKTQPVINSYTNWDTNFPVSWSNLSYWGKRVVAIQPTTGKWKNVEMAYKFTKLICEHYVYQNSDGVNRITPTFPGGAPITIVSSSGHVYSYCGQKVGKDSWGRWIMPKCKHGFPWWAGLIIAVSCYVVVVALIIIIWCCCCVHREKKEEKRRREIIRTEEDNVSHIPTQTELGLSRSSSLRYQSFDSDSGSTYSDSETSGSRGSATLKSGSSSGSSKTDSRSSSRSNSFSSISRE